MWLAKWKLACTELCACMQCMHVSILDIQKKCGCDQLMGVATDQTLHATAMIVVAMLQITFAGNACPGQLPKAANVASAAHTAHASSERSSLENAQSAFDGKTTTHWVSSPRESFPWVSIDLGAPHKLCAIIVLWGKEGIPSFGFELHASSASSEVPADGEWLSVADLILVHGPGRIRTSVPDTITQPLRHVRVRCVTDGTSCAIQEVQPIAIPVDYCGLK